MYCSRSYLFRTHCLYTYIIVYTHVCGYHPYFTIKKHMPLVAKSPFVQCVCNAPVAALSCGSETLWYSGAHVPQPENGTSCTYIERS